MVSPDNGEHLNVDPMATMAGEPKRRNWLTGALILGVVVVIGVAAGWAVSQFGAGGDSSLSAIPADADMVIRVDVDQYGDQVNDLIHAFTVPLAEAGEIDDPDVDVLQLLDEELDAEAGISFTEDIAPWIGSDASAAIFLSSSLQADPDFVLAISVSDSSMAKEFVNDLATQQGADVETQDKEGGTLYFEPSGGADQGYVWVGDDVMLIANDESGIDRALAAAGGESILTSDEYQAVDAELPASPIVELYLSSAVFDEAISQAAAAGAGEDLEMLGNLGGVGLALSIIDSGVQFDTVQISTSDDNPFAGYVFTGADLVAGLPADTFGYLGYSFPEGYFQTLGSQLTEGGDGFTGDFEEGLQQMFGVDLFEELLPSIGPNAIVAAIESSDGPIASEFGVPVGLLFALDLSDPAPMTDLVAGLEGLAAAEGIEISGDEVKAIIVDGNPVAALTISEDKLALATSSSLLDTFLGGAGGLTSTDLYQELDAALVGDGLQTFFDLESIFDELPIPADERAVLAPIRGFGAAAEASSDVVRGQAVLLIDY